MTTRRVKLKLGLAEVEIEGEQDDLHEEALSLLERMVDMVPFEPPQESPAVVLNSMSNSPTLALENEVTTSGKYDFSVDMIANNRNCASTSDLAVAADIYLHFVLGQNEFDRNKILEAMKSATSFYKANMRNNHTKTLRSLVKNEVLLARASGKYALSNATRTSAETSLAELG